MWARVLSLSSSHKSDKPKKAHKAIKATPTDC